ncbi:hypothetical protein C731_0655 [Mycolicibacterium hassiacum DSM 44199]|uniref:Uncharacterized protein n=1 Tax=Mycolicibacterium hassiacum (strain DSM 44199 / CIP 105218 / JCM 12690 / 3849) TaxID=1122247 RepID=K5BKR7_MYCHD|nr:hypothetical protein [Mycolicibacterium hassiacum]EKF25334.1 hypothetical protein C731_0655 [Mycolicibacterium hassiacum DSM 44199]MBX5487123.1 hypothetical protein [Mycolicibacterium hassiacum]MDA4085672.1 hypothetical protein [Mycolicibacterium hassiacum DSM 44199]PZN22656.1 MAG: hypothetical protein DIU75_07245 [Mycolicibacterium hassiacum]VCT93069.1 hypothetical protein MHAS_04807 [Mycolicibacterium hassiacum DSM 44199]
MRFVATLFGWLITTVLLAVAVVSLWAQRTLVDEDGYAALAADAARNPALQRAMAAELRTQIIDFAAGRGYRINSDLVAPVVNRYTANPGFPGQFAQANRIAHRWMFTNEIRSDSAAENRWLVDIAPMLTDPSIRQTLGDLNLDVPDQLLVPITVPETSGLQPGRLRTVAVWGPWVSAGSAVLAAVFALLTLAAARARGKTIAALGVSALLVGAAGWAGIEVARGHIDRALDHTVGNIREIAEVMVAQAEAGLHHWLNLTLAGGGVLVLVGVAVAALGGLLRRGD